MFAQKAAQSSKYIDLHMVQAYSTSAGLSNVPVDYDAPAIYCPESVLSAFQTFVAKQAPALLGALVKSSYPSIKVPSQEEEKSAPISAPAAAAIPEKQHIIKLPSHPAQFTARHLQLLARNERTNIDGRIKVDLYHGLLSEEQIAYLRVLVKATSVSGKSYAVGEGGYRTAQQRFDTPMPVIIVDQAGYQWQKSIYNSGALFLYPDEGEKLPKGYTEWQRAAFEASFDFKRPKKCGSKTAKVLWHGISGQLDLDQIAMAHAHDFLQALAAANSQAELALDKRDMINFKFLNAGMGFFVSGLGMAAYDVQVARLQGIKQALIALNKAEDSVKKHYLSKVGCLTFPFSKIPHDTDNHLRDIQAEVVKLKLEWGGGHGQDALACDERFVTATTNCGDPHAMIGNEGGYNSVDAAIATNAYVNHLNAGYNPHIGRVVGNAPIPADTLYEKSASLEDDFLARFKFNF